MQLTKSSQELVKKNGGAQAFSELIGASKSACDSWLTGRRKMPEWECLALDWAIQNGYEVRK
ncbi:MAG: hypothetical protein DRH97_00355 [Chloroflexi bacterium]|nr:MAG: hypothetical protein DRH97_00355 [Chloroflexota bacterium]